jgi:hypothetical protein
MGGAKNVDSFCIQALNRDSFCNPDNIKIYVYTGLDGIKTSRPFLFGG